MIENNEQLHPGHHAIRLPNRDYSAPGFYFLRVCAYEKSCILGRVLNERTESSALGKLVTEGWVAIPSHFVQTRLHAFVLMPNHVHGVIEIAPQAGAQGNSSQVIEDKLKVARGSLGAIVRSFKAAVTKRAREELRWAGDVWQRNYFERVLRDEQEFADASAYIKGNIKRWGLVVDGAQRAAALQGRSEVSWSHGIHRFTRAY